MRYALILLLPLLLAGCASVSERAARQTWEQERARWSPESGTRDRRAGNSPELGPDATLDDYERYALLNNPGLRAAFSRWKAALERVVPARRLEDPRFTYAYQVRNVETSPWTKITGILSGSYGIIEYRPWNLFLSMSPGSSKPVRLVIPASSCSRNARETEKLVSSGTVPNPVTSKESVLN